MSWAHTWKPSVSGSWTSRRTTSGRRRQHCEMADAPSSASPTTSNPSDSSTMRALARKDGWSSTMRTVQAICRRLWLQVDGGPIRLAVLRSDRWSYDLREPPDHGAGVLGSEDGGARDEQRGARLGARVDGRDIDAAVDLEGRIVADQRP